MSDAEHRGEDGRRRIVLLLMHVWWGWGFDLRDGFVIRDSDAWQRMYGEPPEAVGIGSDAG